MIKSWSDAALEDFEYWMKQDKKTLKRILQLLKDIDRNGYDGIGKPYKQRTSRLLMWGVIPFWIPGCKSFTNEVHKRL